MSDNLNDAFHLLRFYNPATDGDFPDYAKQIAATLSATPVSGKTAVFYSAVGDVESLLKGHPDFTTLGQTEVGQFLNSDQFRDAVRDHAPADAYHVDANGNSSRVYNHPYHEAIGGGSKNSVWGEASKRFAKEVTGDVNFVGPNAKIDRIFGQVELEALLNNDKVTSINGKPVAYFIGLTPEQQFDLAKGSSLSTDIGMEIAGNHYSGLLEDVTKLKPLQFLGTLGDVVELGIAVETAFDQYAAGDFDGGNQTIAEAAVGLVAGYLAATVAMAIGVAAGLTIAPLIALGIAAGVAASWVWDQYIESNQDWIVDLALALGPLWSDPLVIDLDGDGIELTTLEGSAAYFDLDGDGFAERTGWVQPDDAILALDVNGNGSIDDISEVFGSMDNSGFAELADYDDNGDGVIDAQDAIYTSLLLWQDGNGNALSETGELSALSASGIISIDVTPTTGLNHYFEAGNQIPRLSQVTWSDGSLTNIGDVQFNHNSAETSWDLPDGFELDPDVVDLPWLRGHGEVRDSWVEMSEDAALEADAAALVELAATGDHALFSANFDTYLTDWAGSSGWDWFDEIDTVVHFVKNSSGHIVGYFVTESIIAPNAAVGFDPSEFDELLPGWRDLLERLDATYLGIDENGDREFSVGVAGSEPDWPNLPDNLGFQNGVYDPIYATAGGGGFGPAGFVSQSVEDEESMGHGLSAAHFGFLQLMGGRDIGPVGNTVVEESIVVADITAEEAQELQDIYDSAAASMAIRFLSQADSSFEALNGENANKGFLDAFEHIDYDYFGDRVFGDIEGFAGAAIDHFRQDQDATTTDQSALDWISLLRHDYSDSRVAALTVLSTPDIDLQSVLATFELDAIHEGGSGNDVIAITAASKAALGWAGNDSITGTSGSDFFAGGAGDDTLNGGDGNDTYYYTLGDGHDQIHEYYGSDEILFAAGIVRCYHKIF
ncbi:MAG: hypothetical protein AAFV59_16945 [Pseudomonadota bacterium]